MLLQWLRASIGDAVQATPFQPPAQDFAASLVVAEVSRVSTKVKTPLDLEAADLTQHLTTRMNGMVQAASLGRCPLLSTVARLRLAHGARVALFTSLKHLKSLGTWQDARSCVRVCVAASYYVTGQGRDMPLHFIGGKPLPRCSCAQVFQVGPEVAFEYQGQILVLSVRSVLVTDARSGTQQSVERGMLTPDTACTFDAVAASGIKARSCPTLPAEHMCSCTQGIVH